MNNTNHPDTEQLTAYVRDPLGDDYRRLTLHLATCVDCRRQVGLLSSLQAQLPELEAELYQAAVAQNDELHVTLQSQSIEKYLDGQLDETEQARVAEIIRDTPQAMKAALHYAGHSAGMQRQMEGNNGSVAIGQVNVQSQRHRPAGSGFLSSLRAWLELRTPLWLTVPLTAAAATLLGVVLIPALGPYTARPVIVAYQDNPVIQFRPAHELPGIGFFSNAGKTVKPYARVKALVDNDQAIHLAWPGVDNAVTYTMHLKVFANGQQVSVGEITTSATEASFRRAAHDDGQRYVWRLNGKTDSGELFSTQGGFIINAGKP